MPSSAPPPPTAAVAATATVTEDEAGLRLDRWLRRRQPGLPQSAIQKLCRTGQLRIDGHRAEAATRLAPGQAVRLPPLAAAPQPAAAEPRRPPDPKLAEALQRAVLYRDDQVLVLNKPPGLPVQGGPGITVHLDAAMDALRFGADRPRLVHRLDRDTSGVLVLARTPGVAAKLAAAFRSRSVEKTYWAVVARLPVPSEGRIDLPLRRFSGLRGGRTAPAERSDPEAARAITEFRTLDHAGKLAWLELQPLTGRTHQLRVHCVAIGAPILGDVTYAEPDQNGAFAATVSGLSEAMHLHARRLVLPHPAGGRLVVEADLPPHMQQSFRTLGFVEPPPAAPRRGPGEKT
ncbi:MAG: RluA family pseudouridine synthase [Rhodospirillales bacterium]|jgi:23S rRNA pseudouridine955/2504/2580 synthase|nr:RluA family pseudouridine synthase [Rhodospirillales bacterium]